MRRSLPLASILAAACLALAAPGHAADESLFEQGVEAYTAALETSDRDARLAAFRRAERLFDAAARRGGASAALQTNLGNAALQGDHLGGAVLAYRRALRIDPDHARALQNLDHARSLLPDWVPRPQEHGLLDTFFFWHRTLSAGQRQTLGAWLFAAAAVLLATGIRWRIGALRALAVVPALAWGALLASVALEGGGEAWAVVTVDEVVARSADSELAPSPFSAPLPGGTEVVVVERREPWLRVRLAGGRDAWLRASSVTAVDARDPSPVQ